MLEDLCLVQSWEVLQSLNALLPRNTTKAAPRASEVSAADTFATEKQEKPSVSTSLEVGPIVNFALFAILAGSIAYVEANIKRPPR